MIPVSTLYHEYIGRPKLTEQKNPFEYIVPPPPSRGVETKNENRLNFGTLIGIFLKTNFRKKFNKHSGNSFTLMVCNSTL